MGNTNLVPYETIVRATSGDPDAVDEVLRHYGKRIRYAFLLLFAVKTARECKHSSRFYANLLGSEQLQ